MVLSVGEDKFNGGSMRRYVWVVHDNDRGNEGICKLFRNKKDAVKLFNSIADDFEQSETRYDELEIDRKGLLIQYDSPDSWGMVQVYKEEIQ